MAFPAITSERVTLNTDDEINRRILAATKKRVARLAKQGANEIDGRLKDLDREWDIERCLETGASSLVILGTLLGSTVNRRWYWLPVGVAGFLLQHALQGWCPPLPIFRRLGVRTADEINAERMALRTLRGDFRALELQPAESVVDAVSSVRHWIN